MATVPSIILHSVLPCSAQRANSSPGFPPKRNAMPQSLARIGLHITCKKHGIEIDERYVWDGR